VLRWAPIHYAHNGDVSIAYTVGGEGPVDLLFIGGFVNHLEIGVELPLAQRFWERIGSFARVIAFDKRGMGLSDRDAAAYTLENIVDDALAVLDACGVERAVVFGVSEGGSAATMLAATHPDRVSAMVQYGTYARVSRAEDYPEGIPPELTRRYWNRMIESWVRPSQHRRLGTERGARPGGTRMVGANAALRGESRDHAHHGVHVCHYGGRRATVDRR
jgi:pimeloyl-ACP methyl ester carboxylesterase